MDARSVRAQGEGVRRLRLLLLACLGAVLALPATASAGWVAGDMGGADPMPSIHRVTADSADGSLWASGSDGVWRSTDDGLTWSRLPAGPGSASDVAVGGGIVWAYGPGPTIWRSDDAGATWSTIATSWPHAGGLVADPGTGEVFVTSADGPPAPRVARVVGGVVSDWSSGLAPAAIVSLVGVDPSTHRVYARGLLGGLVARAPGDPVWAGVPGSGPIVEAALDTSTSPATIVGATSGAAILRSTDGGATWLPTTGPAVAGSAWVGSIAAASGRIAVVVGGNDGVGLAVSDDAGATWQTWRHASSWAADVLTILAGGTVVVSDDDGVAVAAPAARPASSAGPLTSPQAWGTGPQTVGSLFHGDAGAWLGTSAPSRQWVRCVLDDPDDCAAIPGATGADHTATWADVEHDLRLRVTAGGAVVDSGSAAVNLRAPELVSPPSLVGPLVVGSTIDVVPGTWLGADTVERVVLVCPPDGGSCRVLDGPPFVLTAAEQGHTVVVHEFPTNAYGMSPSGTDSLGPVLGAPRTIAVAAIDGVAEVGRTLTFDAGLERDGDIATTYGWTRCMETCSPIQGATAETYAVTAADQGFALRASATATNPRGTRHATALTGVVPTVPAGPPATPPVTPPATPPVTPPATSGPTPAKPALRTRPAVTGRPRPTRLLTCTTGRWANAPTRHAYRWLRDGVVLKGAARTYRVTGADRGTRLACRVTATNAGGSTTATSAAVRVPAPARR